MLKDKDMREDQDGGGGEDDDDDWIEPTKAVGNRRKVKSLLVWTVLHNSPILDEYQTQSAWVLPWKRAHQDNSNDTPQPICECQVDFPLLWIKAYPGLS